MAGLHLRPGPRQHGLTGEAWAEAVDGVVRCSRLAPTQVQKVEAKPCLPERALYDVARRWVERSPALPSSRALGSIAAGSVMLRPRLMKARLVGFLASVSGKAG